MRPRWRKRRGLAERLRPYLPSPQQSEPMVDADPIRMFLFQWMIETGDPIEVVAKGFGLDLDLVDSILSGRMRSVSASSRAELLALGLRVEGRQIVDDRGGLDGYRNYLAY